MLLTVFQQYLEGNRESLAARGVEIVEISPAPAHATVASMFADFSTETRMGRITLWHSGGCDVEVLEINSADQLLWKHYDILASADLTEAIDTFLETLTADR